MSKELITGLVGHGKPWVLYHGIDGSVLTAICMKRFPNIWPVRKVNDLSML